jgi:hypothetical protein
LFYPETHNCDGFSKKKAAFARAFDEVCAACQRLATKADRIALLMRKEAAATSKVNGWFQ